MLSLFEREGWGRDCAFFTGVGYETEDGTVHVDLLKRD